jgi:AcrR family transcriptional regulator
MPTSRAYRPRRSTPTAERTKARIMTAVRELLAEGGFHEATVEEVAERAGVARATLYQHFGSRLGLVDAMCDTFGANPALLAVRDAVRLDDLDRALAEAIHNTVRFWASEEPVLEPLYGVAAVDPAAQALVERQRADRRGEFAVLARRLREAGRLPKDLSEREALARLLLLTSFETFEELHRHAGLGERATVETLQDSARSLLFS